MTAPRTPANQGRDEMTLGTVLKTALAEHELAVQEGFLNQRKDDLISARAAVARAEANVASAREALKRIKQADNA